MTRDEKMAEARRMQAEGLTLQQITERLGYRNHSSTWNLLHPDEAKAAEQRQNAKRSTEKRAWENKMRATCAHCGGLLRAGSLRADGSQRAVEGDACASCRSRHRVERVLAMWRLRVDENLTNKAIAERLSTPLLTVRTELNRLRALGYDVPCAAHNGADKRGSTASALDGPAVTLGKQLAERGIHPSRTAA